jgi:hypothetical protein
MSYDKERCEAIKREFGEAVEAHPHLAVELLCFYLEKWMHVRAPEFAPPRQFTDPRPIADVLPFARPTDE